MPDTAVPVSASPPTVAPPAVTPPSSIDLIDNAAHPAVGEQPATQTNPAAPAPAGVDVPEEPGLAIGAPNVPAAADSPVFGIQLSGQAVAGVAVLLALAVIAPLFMSDRGDMDKFALLCLLPAVAAAVWVAYAKRDEVHFRQVFIRFAGGWLLLTPISWFGACMLLMVWFTIAVLFLFNVLPVTLGAIIFWLGVFASIVTMEEILKCIVLKNYDNIGSMPNPAHYPLYSAATAMGMGSAASYYLILFIRSLLDAAALNDCRYEADYTSTPTPVPSGLSRAPLATSPPVTSMSRAQCKANSVTPGQLAMLIIVCIVLLQPMQILASYHLGLIIARVQVLHHKVAEPLQIAPIVAVRTLFFFGFIAGTLYIGAMGWLMPLFTLLIYVVFVKFYEKSMPRAYLDRVGYLNLFGYGAIASDDIDEDDLSMEAAAQPRMAQQPSPPQPQPQHTFPTMPVATAAALQITHSPPVSPGDEV
jgi:hypothetical protein